MRLVNLTGQKFGEWEVVTYVGGSYWLCVCSCGTSKHIYGGSLRAGTSTNCGCKKPGNRTHGMRKSPEYKSWLAMRRRCSDPKNGSYERYGAVGITVCERWKESFENFFADMGPKPKPEYQIERIDSNGNYEPSNCRWVTVAAQCRNRKSNRMFTHNGKTMCVKDWAKELGLNHKTVNTRINQGHLSIAAALGLE